MAFCFSHVPSGSVTTWPRSCPDGPWRSVRVWICVAKARLSADAATRGDGNTGEWARGGSGATKGVSLKEEPTLFFCLLPAASIVPQPRASTVRHCLQINRVKSWQIKTMRQNKHFHLSMVAYALKGWKEGSQHWARMSPTGRSCLKKSNK